MNLDQAERRFRQYQAARDRGDLDESMYRVRVAGLMFRDAGGVFWMIDAGDGAWYRNRGDAWEQADPRAEGADAALPPDKTRRPRWQRAAIGALLTAVVALALVVIALRWPGVLPGSAPPAPAGTPGVQVSIASPSTGSEVAAGYEVAVESMLQSAVGLASVDRVELLVGGQAVDVQTVRARVQAGQTSLPVSQHWMPADLGEWQVTVRALSASDEPLAQAAITLRVTEASVDSAPEPACSPDAAFVAHVTIPPGTAFQPAAQMDKVWQVRNSGTCAWGVGYQLVRIEGEALDAADTVSVPPTAAGGTAYLAITFRAPSTAGTYTSSWQLRTPDGTQFGPVLELSITVQSEAEASVPPDSPTGLQAAVTEDGTAVQIAWQDQSQNEDAFRVYRGDMEASIGLAPANAQLFLDRTVACGNTYEYHVVAFNAAGVSTSGDTVEVTLPPCAPAASTPTPLPE